MKNIVNSSKVRRISAAVGLGMSLQFAGFLTAAECVMPPSGAVLWLRGENNVHDTIGNHTVRIHAEAGYATGLVGSALKFDGVDDMLEVDDREDLNPQQLTLEAWIKPDFTNQVSRIISKEISGDPCLFPNLIWSLDVRGDMEGRAAFFCTIGDNLVTLSSTSLIPPGQFTHVAGTYDGTRARIYINGRFEKSTRITGSLPSSTAPVLIGNSSVATRACFSGSGAYPGLIDEVAVYNRALDAAEIKALFDAGSAGKCPPPVLNISSSDNKLVISWSPTYPGFILEQSNTPDGGWLPGPAGNPTPPIVAQDTERYFRVRRP